VWDAADPQGHIKRNGAGRITAMSSAAGWAPRRMIAPLPNCRSIWATARLSAFSFDSFAPFIVVFIVSTNLSP
jgi:hypothetical protein